MAEPGLRVALLSLEPWDDVWRRNQHLATELRSAGVIEALQWVSPPEGRLAVRSRTTIPAAGIEVLQPPLLVPRRYGGYHVMGAWFRRRLRPVDLLWINDPVAGVHALRAGVPAVYDVTDDWRSMPQDDATRRRIEDAEDRLARRAVTIVCSTSLAERWRDRYGVEPAVVPNGVDTDPIAAASPRQLEGTPPHVVYVGTLHDNRLDLDLIAAVARTRVATVHLVGPDYLSDAQRSSLRASGVRFHGAVPAHEVPAWLVSADVLMCPHLVDDFTLSLDAIKAHEYLATSRPVVATPSSGFQALEAAGLVVCGREQFAAAVRAAIGSGPFARPAPVTWATRAAEFAEILRKAVVGSGARIAPDVRPHE